VTASRPGGPLYGVFDVFTPTSQAKLNFVERPSLNARVEDALRTPGKQVVVYGETGSGKSTLLQNKLHQYYSDHITSRCTAATTFESLLLDAFDQLNSFYTSSATAGRSVKRGLNATFSAISAGIENQATSGSVANRLLTPQLTPQRLGEFLGAQSLCWVIEDIHKTAESEKLQLAQTFKLFSDLAAEYPNVKIVAIGATETAREVVQYDPEMANRVAELHVPLMQPDELSLILSQGQAFLNVDLHALSEDFVRYSMGVASSCHQLALNACLEKGITVMGPARVTFTTDDLQPAVERYVEESSDTLKSHFDMALHRQRVRRYHNCHLILTALASAPVEGLIYSELLSAVRDAEPDYPAGNLTTYLRQLLDDERSNILRLGGDQRYRFIDPLHHAYAQLTLLSRPASAWQPDERIYLMVSNYLTRMIQPGPLSSSQPGGSVSNAALTYPSDWTALYPGSASL
jgi:AAA domain